jgi:hypothetical protein
VGRCRFWFDIHDFDQEWLTTTRLDEALKTAGPRYTPEIHVDLPIAREFDAFGRTERLFDHIKSYARDLGEAVLPFYSFTVLQRRRCHPEDAEDKIGIVVLAHFPSPP